MEDDTKGAPSDALAILIALSMLDCAKPSGECDVMCPTGERVDTSVCACVSAGDSGAAIDASYAEDVDAVVQCDGSICAPGERCTAIGTCCPMNALCIVEIVDAGGE
jgi:hypothetical protein